MLCVGPEGTVYPCPALVGDASFAAGNLRERSLETIWRDAPVLETVRNLSVIKQEGCDACEIRFLCGGGCLSQTYYRTGRLDGPDPYCDVYRNMILDDLGRLAATVHCSCAQE